MSLRITLPIKPPTTTHQQKAVKIVNGKVIHYEPEKVKEARQTYRAYLAKYVPENPYTQPLVVNVYFCFPLKGIHKDSDPYTNKPDCDNAVKLLLDAMTECGFWKDDSQIFSLNVMKFWSSSPCVKITVMTEAEFFLGYES